MAIKITQVKNAKTANAEYVVLKASQKINLKGYAIVDRTFSQDGIISNDFRHIYFFPDYEVGQNEYVILHTGSGTARREERGTTKIIIHHFYWGVNSCVWNNDGGDTASLFKYSQINTVAVPAVEE